MGASAAAGAAFGGGGGSTGTSGGIFSTAYRTQAQDLAQQHIARMEAMRRQGGLSMNAIARSMIAAAQGPQVGTAEQIAASGINDRDPNNLSFGSSYAGPVTQANSGMNRPGGFSMADLGARAAEIDLSNNSVSNYIQEATGNAPNNNITAGMAVGNAPIATAGNFNPQTQFAAAQMFGNGTQFVKPKKLINL